MSMKYEYLEELKNDFITALQDAVKKADNEDDMDKLDAIAEETVCEIPTELMLKDYWTRSAVIGRITDEEKQQDTDYINSFMKYLYNKDVVCFDEQVTYDIDDCDLDFVNHNNKGE